MPKDKNNTYPIHRICEEIIESLDDAFFALDKELRIIRVNRYAENLLSLRRDDLIGKSFIDSVPESAGIITEARLRKALNAGKDIFEEVFSETGPFSGAYELRIHFGQETIVIFLRRITESKKEQDYLRRVNDSLERVVDQTPSPMWLADSKGTIIRINQALRDLLQIKDEAVVGRYNIFNDSQVREQDLLPLVEKVFYSGETVGFSMDYNVEKEKNIRSDSRVHCMLEIKMSAIKDENGRITNVICLHKDVTAQRQAEEKLSESELRFRAAFSQSFQFQGLLDPEGRIIDINDLAGRVSKGGHEDLRGLPIAEAPWWKDIDETARKTFTGIENAHNGHTTRDEITYYDKEGGLRYALRSFSPVRDEKGRIILISIQGQDITDRRDTEESLKKSEAMLKTILKAAPIGISLVVERKFLWVNDMALDILGYSEDELKGQSARLIYPDNAEFERVGNTIYKNIEHGIMEVRFRRKDGTVFNALLNSSPLNPQDYSQGIIFTMLDITQRKRALENLRQRELWISSLIELLPVGFTECDSKANIVRANKAYAEICGFSREELIGKWSGDMLVPGKQKDEFAGYIEYLVKEKPEPEKYVSKTLSKDGTMRDTEVYWDYILQGGEVTGFVCLVRDVTAEKLAEESEKALIAAKTTVEVERSKAKELKEAYAKLQEAQMQLIKAEKLSSIGILASGVAHELNSPLAGIISLLGNYLKKGRAEEIVETENLKIMLEASEYMAKIVRELTLFARDSKGAFTGLNINEVIESTLNFSGYYLTKNKIDIRKTYAQDLPEVYGDRSQLQQVVLNMITNARDAMPEGGSLTIRSYSGKTGGAGAQKVFVEFIDTGLGIEDNYKAKIFDLFYTNKEPGKGVGLGLPISHNIMESHQGNIEVLDNPEGRGAVFRLIFPVRTIEGD